LAEANEVAPQSELKQTVRQAVDLLIGAKQAAHALVEISYRNPRGAYQARHQTRVAMAKLNDFARKHASAPGVVGVSVSRMMSTSDVLRKALALEPDNADWDSTCTEVRQHASRLDAVVAEIHGYFPTLRYENLPEMRALLRGSLPPRRPSSSVPPAPSEPVLSKDLTRAPPSVENFLRVLLGGREEVTAVIDVPDVGYVTLTVARKGSK
jgi:hypothetical protein